MLTARAVLASDALLSVRPSYVLAVNELTRLPSRRPVVLSSGLSANINQFREHRQRIDDVVWRFVANIETVIIAVTHRYHATPRRTRRANVVDRVAYDQNRFNNNA